MYDLIIHCDATCLSLPSLFTVRLKPLPDTTARPKDLLTGKINKMADFKGYSELQLSPYLEAHVCYQGTAIKSFITEMQIDLPGTRMDKIFRSIIDDKEKFFKYLAFLLEEDSRAPYTRWATFGYAEAKRRQPGEPICDFAV